jgi:cation transport ATPase
LIIGAILFAAGLLTKENFTVSFVLFLLAWFTAGWSVLYNAAGNIAKGRIFDENLFMTPSKLIESFKTAAITRKIALQNITFAISIKVLILLLDVTGLATMWEAVFADVGVTLLAVLNTLRIGIKFKAPVR